MLRYADNGQPELLDYLVQLNGKDLYHFLLSQTDVDLAGDLSQSTWLKVIEKRTFYRKSGRFKSWLFTLGRHQMIDFVRQSNRWQMIEWDDELLATPDLSDEMIGKDELAQFNHLLSQLPFLQKEAFILQQEGFSLVEIASIAGENSETIKSRLRYARNFFKQHLTTQHLTTQSHSKDHSPDHLQQHSPNQEGQ